MSKGKRATAGAALVVLAGVGAFAVVSRAGRGREVRWRREGVELVGRLSLPATPGRHPLAVIVPGSGCMPLSHRFYQAHTRELPRRGIAVFAYDKRGCGASTGDWRDVDLHGLADDVLAVLPTLAADSSIDAAAVGLWGLSQGGWVSLIAAAASPRVAYVVLLSGPPMTPALQGDEVVALGMRARGMDAASIAAAVTLNQRLTEVYRSDSGWDEAQAALAAASTQPWFDSSGVGLIPRQDSTYWRWLRRILDYDPLPALGALKIPILGVYGERDLLVPGPRSKAIIESLAPSAAGPRMAVVVPGAGHQLRPGAGTAWSPEYWVVLEQWMRQQGMLRAPLPARPPHRAPS